MDIGPIGTFHILGTLGSGAHSTILHIRRAADGKQYALKVVPLENLEEEAMAMANKIARMHPFALSMAKRAVNQTMDIMGQYAALQSVFDIHQLGHGSALAMTGEAVLMGLDGLKPANKS